MKRILFVVLLFALTMGLSEAYSGQGADGAALWKKIAVTSPYKMWKQFPDHEGLQYGEAPHGDRHIVYVNNAALKKGWPKPYGTVIVKENYTGDEKLAAITVMYKIEGFNPEAGDWFWVKYGPDGTVHKEGKPGGCIGCHSLRKSYDFIMVSDH